MTPNVVQKKAKILLRFLDSFIKGKDYNVQVRSMNVAAHGMRKRKSNNFQCTRFIKWYTPLQKLGKIPANYPF